MMQRFDFARALGMTAFALSMAFVFAIILM
jgi:hypothetical protein